MLGLPFFFEMEHSLGLRTQRPPAQELHTIPVHPKAAIVRCKPITVPSTPKGKLCFTEQELHNHTIPVHPKPAAVRCKPIEVPSTPEGKLRFTAQGMLIYFSTFAPLTTFLYIKSYLKSTFWLYANVNDSSYNLHLPSRMHVLVLRIL
jgi:hypothetical protein